MLRKSSMPDTFLNLESSITRLEWQAVDELDQTGHRLSAAQVRNVDTFDRSRRFLQFEHLLQSSQSFFGIDMKDFWLGVSIQFATPISDSQHFDFVSQLGRFFKCHLLGSRQHLFAQLFEQLFLVAGQEHLQPFDVFAILLLGNSQVAGRGALFDAGQQTGAKPLPAFVVGIDIQRTGPKLENPLQAPAPHRATTSAGKRTVQLDADVEGSRVTSTRGKSS